MSLRHIWTCLFSNKFTLWGVIFVDLQIFSLIPKNETLSNNRFTNKISSGGSLSEGYVDQYFLAYLLCDGYTLSMKKNQDIYNNMIKIIYKFLPDRNPTNISCCYKACCCKSHLYVKNFTSVDLQNLSNQTPTKWICC